MKKWGKKGKQNEWATIVLNCTVATLMMYSVGSALHREKEWHDWTIIYIENYLHGRDHKNALKDYVVVVVVVAVFFVVVVVVVVPPKKLSKCFIWKMLSRIAKLEYMWWFWEARSDLVFNSKINCEMVCMFFFSCSFCRACQATSMEKGQTIKMISLACVSFIVL